MEGRVVERDMWKMTMYNGRAARLRRKSAKYVIWSQNETFADAVDYDMTVHEVLDDLALC